MKEESSVRLENEGVYLRNLHEADAPTMLDTTKNEEMRYMTGTKHNFTLDQIKSYIEKVKNDSSRCDFAICLKGNDSMIGDLSILDINKEDNKAGFRIALSTIDLTGKGYGTAAIRSVLPFVFDKLGLNRLQLEVYSHNLRGIRAYEKVGFVKEGVLRQSLLYKGSYSDEIIMAILKEDYVNLLKGNL